MAVESAATAPTEEFVAPGKEETAEEMVAEEGGGGEIGGDIGDVAVNEENRHPLQDSWALWYLNCDKTKSWDDRLIKLMTFDTVEDFWACYHHVQARVTTLLSHLLFMKNIGYPILSCHPNYQLVRIICCSRMEYSQSGKILKIAKEENGRWKLTESIEPILTLLGLKHYLLLSEKVGFLYDS